MNKFNSLYQVIKNAGFLSLLKVSYFKIIQRFKNKFVLPKIVSASKIIKNGKFFTNELYNNKIFKDLFLVESKEVIERADKIIQKKFYFLGSNFVFGNSINWHCDPEDKIEWQKKIYDERRLIYNGSPKDPKIIWELNRHQYLFTLAKAYFISDEEKYAKEVLEHLKSWIENNPIGIGINWSSPLEISIRLISWVFALDLIESSSVFAQYQETIYKSIYQQTKYLASKLSIDRLIRTNHLLGELAGLFVVSNLFKFKESNQFILKSIKLFTKEISKQVFIDGVSKEQSTSYHRFVIDFVVLLFVISERYNFPFPAQLKYILNKMLSYLMHVTMPDGTVPSIGDSDDGRGVKFSDSEDFWNMLPQLSSGSVIFENVEMKFVSKKFFEENFWLFGLPGLNKFNSITPIMPEVNQHNFNYAGHYIIRNSFDRNSDFLFVRAGIFGMGGDGHSSHSHDDLLSPIICVNGTQILVDSGTYVYNGNPAERNKFKCSKAHNAITWDFEISKPKQGFGWLKTYNSKLEKSNINSDFIEYVFSIKSIPEYKRRIVYNIIKRKFLIEDQFSREFGVLEWRLHIPPKVLSDKTDFGIELNYNNKKTATIISNIDKYSNIESDYISNYYGIKEKIQVIVFKKSVSNGEKVWFEFF